MMASERIDNRVVVEVLNNEEWHTIKVGYFLFFLENQYVILYFLKKRSTPSLLDLLGGSAHPRLGMS